MRTLVTGAKGSLGAALVPRLQGEVCAIDIEQDICDEHGLRALFARFQPDLVYHLAGAKSAPEGEGDPARALQVNAVGTENVLRAAGRAHVVTASTCKACDPETVYGASKLLAERLTLGAGGSVARFYNVRESAGNVFELRRSLPKAEPLPVTDCRRFFISMEQALKLLLAVPGLPPGRYTVDPGLNVSMVSVAAALYPLRPVRWIPPRRGDRLVEPLHASSEPLVRLEGGIWRIESRHDGEQKWDEETLRGKKGRNAMYPRPVAAERAREPR